MTIKLYNTLTKQKETFSPKRPGKVDMYVCGPTTYNYIHLGNARPLIVFDTVRRYLEYRGYEVNYVQNFTDIDDKIIKRAAEEQMDALKLAAKYIEEYFCDAGALGVRKATLHPKVSEHIPEIIEMIQVLINKGFAYAVDGDVYFAVKKFPGYGKLSGRSLDDMQAGARVEIDTRKGDPMDFALWKSAKPGEPSWDSPWGKGRPGWHIECSVMSHKYLGEGFDIHGGGFDLIFPHHENEIAQSEAYMDGKPFARYWMHNGFITVNQEKMSKSLGNFFTVREILAKFHPEVVRIFMLSTHYRSPLDFHDGKLEESQKALERLNNTLAAVEEVLKNGTSNETGAVSKSPLTKVAQETERKFQEAMDDDFNTALALATLFDLARDINAQLAKLRGKVLAPEEGTSLNQAAATLRQLGKLLGLFERQPETVGADQGLADGLMEVIISIRQQARKNKDWATADQIRDQLATLGIVLEDSPQGVRWKRRS